MNDVLRTYFLNLIFI
jgi:solute carrier family 25 aspartate/glutamate transporter 12/13